ncbi:hypothetical protein GCM10010350_69450 [Streptomyces galilaeus]|nr:hypothetical protein GCM10010350_69450 [Streptomyces galilaeus]
MAVGTNPAMDPMVAVASRAATVLLDKWVLLITVFSNTGAMSDALRGGRIVGQAILKVQVSA